LGLTFVIPEGWVGQEGEGLYIVGHNSIPGIILVIPHADPMTRQQMVDESFRGLVFGPQTTFKPVDKVTTLDKHSIGGEFIGTYDGQPARSYIIGMSNPHGNGITIVAVTSEEKYRSDTHQRVALELKSTVKFEKVKSNQQIKGAVSEGTIDNWKYQLGNTRLTFSESYSSGGEYGGGYSLKEEIHLCNAGYFIYVDQSLVAASNESTSGYSGGNSKGNGKWDIIDRGGSKILILSFNDGTSKEYSLAWGEENKLFLNNNRYLRTWEGEYAPDCSQ
jgi:hypothetical protein